MLRSSLRAGRLSTRESHGTEAHFIETSRIAGVDARFVRRLRCATTRF